MGTVITYFISREEYFSDERFEQTLANALATARSAHSTGAEIWIAGKELGDSRKVGTIDVLHGQFTAARGAPVRK